jgi:hypothetical protein
VLNDVRNGYVTQQMAREVYRVSVDVKDSEFVLHDSETRVLRSQQ